MSSSIHNIDTLREAAITLLREVESLASQQEPAPVRLGLQEEVQRYESELIREALQRTRGNVGEAAGLLAAFCLERIFMPRQVKNVPALLEEFQSLLRSQGIPSRGR